jgi:hypothetical protein
MADFIINPILYRPRAVDQSFRGAHARHFLTDGNRLDPFNRPTRVRSNSCIADQIGRNIFLVSFVFSNVMF